jgi:hypothetical protein
MPVPGKAAIGAGDDTASVAGDSTGCGVGDGAGSARAAALSASQRTSTRPQKSNVIGSFRAQAADSRNNISSGLETSEHAVSIVMVAAHNRFIF